jgi:hypothetical protein
MMTAWSTKLLRLRAKPVQQRELKKLLHVNTKTTTSSDFHDGNSQEEASKPQGSEGQQAFSCSCSETAADVASTAAAKPASDGESTGDSAGLNLNLETGAAREATDALILNVMRQKGRLDKIRKQREYEEEQGVFAERLSKMGRVSSSTLNEARHLMLGPDVMQKVAEVQAVKDAQEQKTKENRAIADAAAQKRLADAKKKEAENKKLNVADLKALVKALRIDGDSPLKTTKEGLEKQYQHQKTRASNLAEETNDLTHGDMDSIGSTESV